jgi:hypothetical protein
MKLIKSKYNVQKACAKRRNIPFNLTFDEWYKIWLDSGHFSERGCKKGQYVMSRYNDLGAYEIGNVFIQTNTNNVSQAQSGIKRKLGPMSEEHKRKISIARTGIKLSGTSKLKGRPQSEEHKLKNKLAQLKRFANVE